jgi:hypothetical protein
MIRHAVHAAQMTTEIQSLATCLERVDVAILFGDLCNAAPLDLMVLADALEAPLIYAFADPRYTGGPAVGSPQPMDGGWASATIAVWEGRVLLVLGVPGAYGRLQHLSDGFVLVSPQPVRGLRPEHAGFALQGDVQGVVTRLLGCFAARWRRKIEGLDATQARPAPAGAVLGLVS